MFRSRVQGIAAARRYASAAASDAVPVNVAFPGVSVDATFKASPRVGSITRLDNGVRVATTTGDGPIATVGVFLDAGARHETASTTGASHFLKALAYKSTSTKTYFKMTRDIEGIGAIAAASSGREHIVYSADVLKNHAESALSSIADSVRNARIQDHEVDGVRDQVTNDSNSALSCGKTAVLEALHHTAYAGSTLGASIYCPGPNAGLSRSDIEKFRKSILHPRNIVVAGSGVDAEHLKQVAQKYFGDLSAAAGTEKPPKAAYVGGDLRVNNHGEAAYFGIAFEGASWSSEDLPAVTVLQTLLGGGCTSSQGSNPGNGLTSLLGKAVKQSGANSAFAFNAPYTDSGLFGVVASAKSDKLSAVVAEVLSALSAAAKADDAAVEAARNTAAVNYLARVESRAGAFEDLGRQAVASGSYASPEAVARALQSVSASAVQKVAEKALKGKPTVVVYGDSTGVPTYGEISKKF